MKHRAYLSIGEVLGLLVDEFPDVTISKIRFLETQGLVEPERTASGYRKFSDEHVERLRYVMREQKDNYLPLKVIKDRLDGEDGTPAATPRPLPTGAAWATIDTAQAPVISGEHSVERVEILFGDTHESTDGFPIPAAALLQPEPIAEVVFVVAGAVDSDQVSVGHSGGEATPAGIASANGAVAPSVPAGLAVAAPSAATTTPAPAVARAAGGPGEPTPMTHSPAPEPVVAPRTALRTVSSAPSAPSAPSAASDDSWTAAEITAQTGASVKLLDELVSFGLIHPQTVGGTTTYDAASRQIALLALEFASHGLEVRHMKMWRTNAEKETALFEQLILPLVRQRNPQARQQTVSTLSTLCDLGADLRAALVRNELKHYLD